MRRGEWQVLRKEKTFSALAQESQTSMVASDLDRFVNETFWNRTRKRPLYGPATPQEWANLKAWTSSPVVDTFTYRGGNILITPNPTAGDTLAYEYISNQWCETSGGTDQSAWAADTDVGILSEALMRLGIVWRYKQKKGLPWLTDYDMYDSRVKQGLAQDKPQRTINFGDAWPTGRRPGIAVPQGSWTIT